MPVDSRVSATAPAEFEAALRYADALQRFNLQAGNFLVYLAHEYRLLPSELNGFADALNAHRDEVFAKNDIEAEESKNAVLDLACKLGFDIYNSEFKSWLNSFSYNAFCLVIASQDLRNK
jgi:hypothetical protein